MTHASSVNNLTYYPSNITQELKCIPRSIALLNGRIAWIIHQAGYFFRDPLGKVCEKSTFGV